MRNVPSAEPMMPVTILESDLLRRATAGRATGPLLSAATMTPLTSPGAGGCCPGCGGPAGFCAGSDAAARLRTRASSANRMRFMGPALRKRGRWKLQGGWGGKTPTSSPHYDFDAPWFQKVVTARKVRQSPPIRERIVELVRMFASLGVDRHCALQ